MIAKDYRVLKAKGVVEIKTDGAQPEYLRPGYDTTTGEVSQTRSDMVDTSVLQARRAELVEEIKDIDAMLVDVGQILDAKAAELVTEKVIP